MAKAYLLTLSSLAAVAYTASSVAEANRQEGQVVLTDEASMSQIDMKDLVRMHNMIRPERPITKFSDRATANKRMWPAIEYLADTNPDKETPVAATKKTAAKKTPKTTTNGTRGRVSAYAGKRLVAIKPNPRREGTAAHKTFALTEGKGILYEDFKKRGGRRQDLAYDIKYKNIRVVKA